MIKHALATQKPILDMLHRSMDNGRLSHAYLFSGEEGSERLGVALYFCAMLYCKDVCLECKECKDIINFNHLNVIYIEKRPDKKEIVKEQIEALKEELSKTSLKEGPRIYIINDAENMNSACANKLLKFIEEPSNDIYAILLTTNKDAILQTIRSRCQLINLLPMNKLELRKNLLDLCIEEKYAHILPELFNSVDACQKALDDEFLLNTIELVKALGAMVFKGLPNLTLYMKNHMDEYSEKENLELLLKLLLLYFIEAKKKSDDIFIDDLELFKRNKTELTPIIDLIIKSQFNLRYNIDRPLLLITILSTIDKGVKK